LPLTRSLPALSPWSGTSASSIPRGSTLMSPQPGYQLRSALLRPSGPPHDR